MAQKLSYAERARKAQNLSSPTSSSSAPTANIVNDPEPSSTPLPTESIKSIPATKPIVNVWNLRMEKMAAARAAQKSTANQSTETASTPLATTGTSKSDNCPPDGELKKASSSSIDMEREDPFVVKMPQHLQHMRHSSTVSSAPTEVKSKGQQSEQDSWPEVGKAISVSASSSSKSMSGGSNVTDDSSGSMQGNTINSSSNSPRKSEKSKWVSIPKRELQEVADAAVASASKHRLLARKSPRQPPNNSVALGLSTSTSSSVSINTSNPSLNTQQIPSENTSASQSRSESLQSSPNISKGVGKRLLPDANPQESANTLTFNAGLRTGYKDEKAGPIVIPPANVNAPVGIKLDTGSSDSGRDEMSKKFMDSTSRDSDRPDRLQAQSQISHSTSSYTPPTGSGYHTLAVQSPSVYHRLSPFQTSAHVISPQHQQPDFPSAASNSSTGSRSQSGSSSPHTQRLSPSVSTSGIYVTPHPHVAHATPYSHPQYPQYNFSPSYEYSPASPHPHYPHYASQRLLPSTTARPYGEATVMNNGTVPVGVNGSHISPLPDGPAPLTRDKMVFGSIDVTSPESKNGHKVKEVGQAVTKEREAEREKEKKRVFAIAIGVDNGADVPARVRTVQKKSVGNGKTTGGPLPEKEKDGRKDLRRDEKDRKKTRDDDEPRASAATLTGSKSAPEMKWRFGTTSMSPPPTGNLSAPQDAQTDSPPVAAASPPFALDPRGNSPLPAMPQSDPHSPTIAGPHQPPTYHQNYNHVPSSSVSENVPSSHAIPLQVSVSTVSSSSDPDLEVKDFGYGFGDASGLGYAPILAKERQREWEAERERERAAAAAEAAGWQDALSGGTGSEDAAIATSRGISVVKDAERDPGMDGQFSQRDQIQPREHYQGRGRRPGFTSGRGYSGGERGHRRARGMNGFPRGYRSYSNQSHHTHGRGGIIASPISPTNSRGPGGPSSPYSVTPPPHFQTLPIDSSNSSGPLVAPPPLTTPAGYYHPHLSHAPGRPYLPPGYEAYVASPTIPTVSHGPLLGHGHQVHPHPQTHKPSQMHLTPPVPVPMTTISFPLDPTRYYLLGQLEYYLSPQNMAQDLYLRRQMDARGWIPISLIASFNRVRQLTQDVHLVRDVLTLSSLVQVRGNMVRMGGWEQFVLPDAAPSTVEEQPLPSLYQNLTNYYYPDDGNGNGRTGAEGAGYMGLSQAVGQDVERVGLYGAHGGEVGNREGMTGAILVNGHRHDPDEEDEDEVEIVMGQEVGMFMSDRLTS